MNIRYTHWKFLRVVRDHVCDKIIKGIGQAEIDATVYYEQGTWSHADSGLLFEQTYKLTLDHAMMHIYFRDDRHFFTIDISSPINTFIHHCGQDVYKGWLKTLTAHTFYTYIVVQGPRKNYSIKTLYKLKPTTKVSCPLFF